MIGIAFACLGMVVFLGMIAVTEASRMLRLFWIEISAGIPCCDTDVFPDFIPETNGDHPRRILDY